MYEMQCVPPYRKPLVNKRLTPKRDSKSLIMKTTPS